MPLLVIGSGRASLTLISHPSRTHALRRRGGGPLRRMVGDVGVRYMRQGVTFLLQLRHRGALPGRHEPPRLHRGEGGSRAGHLVRRRRTAASAELPRLRRVLRVRVEDRSSRIGQQRGSSPTSSLVSPASLAASFKTRPEAAFASLSRPVGLSSPNRWCTRGGGARPWCRDGCSTRSFSRGTSAERYPRAARRRGRSRTALGWTRRGGGGRGWGRARSRSPRTDGARGASRSSPGARFGSPSASATRPSSATRDSEPSAPRENLPRAWRRCDGRVAVAPPWTRARGRACVRRKR